MLHFCKVYRIVRQGKTCFDGYRSFNEFCPLRLFGTWPARCRSCDFIKRYVYWGYVVIQETLLTSDLVVIAAICWAMLIPG
ncbi:hypothetical protein KCU93_g410, partial [Aureobasidium melanogenum]